MLGGIASVVAPLGIRDQAGCEGLGLTLDAGVVLLAGQSAALDQEISVSQESVDQLTTGRGRDRLQVVGTRKRHRRLVLEHDVRQLVPDDRVAPFPGRRLGDNNDVPIVLGQPVPAGLLRCQRERDDDDGPTTLLRNTLDELVDRPWLRNEGTNASKASFTTSPLRRPHALIPGALLALFRQPLKLTNLFDYACQTGQTFLGEPLGTKCDAFDTAVPDRCQ